MQYARTNHACWLQSIARPRMHCAIDVRPWRAACPAEPGAPLGRSTVHDRPIAEPTVNGRVTGTRA